MDKQSDKLALSNYLSIYDSVENIHRLCSSVTKVCETYSDDDYLYEVSYLAKLMQNDLEELGKKLYYIIKSEDKEACAHRFCDF